MIEAVSTADPEILWTISPRMFTVWVGAVALIAFGLGWVSGFGRGLRCELRG